MATDFKYWAFISYSHADKKWGTWLHSALETFKVPKPLVGAEHGTGEPVPRRIFPVFRDREELPTSSDLGSMISRALEQSRYLIVICSPRAAGSYWVNQEILDFKRLGRANRILALIVDGEPNASDGKPGFGAESECFPQALKYALGADGNLNKSHPAEPIAADARPGMDGKIDCKLKLVAGVLGVNYDDLKRREERRRRHRQRIVIAVSAALVLTFASLTAVAFWQRSVAKTETKKANLATQKAETEEAEALAQKHVAETQKAIAVEKTVEAENEKEQVETQTSADEEDLAREALLRGDPLTAVQHLSLAYEAEPEDPGVRLLLHTAMSGLDGLSTVLHGDAGALAYVEVAPQTGLILTASNDGEAEVWDPKNGSPVAVMGKSGNVSNTIRNATFAPDGKYVFFANYSDAFLEDVTTGKKVSFSPGQGRRFVNLALSSDGKIAIGTVGSAVLSSDGKNYSYTTQIVAYNSSDGHQISQVVIPGAYAVIAAPGSGEQAVLVGGSTMRQVLVVEAGTGKTIAKIPLAGNDMALVSPRGDLVLVNHSPQIQPPDIYSARTGAHVAQLSTKDVLAAKASWSPSGRYVLSAYFYSGGVANEALWDASTWKPAHVWNTISSATAINQAETLLASVSGSAIEVWDLHSGALLKQFNDQICADDSQGAPSTVNSHVGFSPDGTRLINTGGGTCATIWNWQKTRLPQLVLSGDGRTVNSIAFSTDGSRAVTGSNDGTAVVWNAKTGAAEFTLQSEAVPRGAAVPMAFFTPDGKEVVTGGSPPQTGSCSEQAALWNASNGALLRTLNFDAHANVICDTIRVGVGRQGNRAVTVSSDGWGALWDLAAEKQLAGMQTENGANVRALTFSRDGSEFVVADASGYAFVFDSLKGTLKRKVGKPGTPLVAAEIAPQDDKVLTADDKGHIAVWSLADGRALENINGAAGASAVNDVHFSPDGATIIAACDDSKIRTWNAQTGQPELTAAEEKLPTLMPFGVPFHSDLAFGLGPLQAGMLRVSYSPDGSFIAGADSLGGIVVWDAKTGKQLLALGVQGGRVSSLAFSSDGARLGSSGEDGTAKIWDLSLATRTPADIKRELAAINEKPSR